MSTKPALSYWTVQPNGETFSATKIKDWVEQNLTGRVLNACAGETRLNHGNEIIQNDIDPGRDADLHHDVTDLDEVLETASIDTVVYDPPYSENQARETYGIDGLPDPKAVASTFDSLLKEEGTIIQWGFSTTPLPLFEGYTTDGVAIWNLLGRQFDWLASIVRKTADGARHAHRADTATSVRSNTNATSSTSGVATQTADDIQLSYHQLPSNCSQEKAVRQHLNDLVSGYTLDVSPKDRSLDHGDVLVSVSETDTRDADLYLDERTLSDQFVDRGFDTVVIDLPVSAFQENRRYGRSTTGRDTALKREIDSLVANGGRVVQVGHTATLMPAKQKYVREQVAVFAHPAAARDVIVSVDKRPEPIQYLDERSKTPTDIEYEETDAEARYVCQRCLNGTYLDPAWYVDCPECGAHRENYCWDNYEVRPVPHEARIQHHSEVHENRGCPVDRTAIKPPYIEPDDTSRVQTPISQF